MFLKACILDLFVCLFVVYFCLAEMSLEEFSCLTIQEATLTFSLCEDLLLLINISNQGAGTITRGMELAL